MTFFRKNLCGDVRQAVTACLGETIEFRPRIGETKTIKGVFDQGFQQEDMDTETVMATNVLRLFIDLADLDKAPEKNDRVYITDLDKEYCVIDSQEDGQGGAELYLHGR